MDKAKLLNIFILAFLLSLVVQYMFVPKNTGKLIQTDVTLEIQDDTLTIPNIPQVSLHNVT